MLAFSLNAEPGPDSEWSKRAHMHRHTRYSVWNLTFYFSFHLPRPSLQFDPHLPTGTGLRVFPLAVSPCSGDVLERLGNISFPVVSLCPCHIKLRGLFCLWACVSHWANSCRLLENVSIGVASVGTIIRQWCDGITHQGFLTKQLLFLQLKSCQLLLFSRPLKETGSKNMVNYGLLYQCF